MGNNQNKQIQTSTTSILVVDVQERLISQIDQKSLVLWNIQRLIKAAKCLDVRIGATEQVPSKLGSTLKPIANLITSFHAKESFSCEGCKELMSSYTNQNIQRVVLVGIETHICILQSCLYLLAKDYDVYVVSDAVGSRYPHDHEVSIARMRQSGAVITTTESLMFEWCKRASNPQFKSISNLAKEKMTNNGI